MHTFTPLTTKNWTTHKKDILNSEYAFHKNLRGSEQEIFNLLRRKDQVSLVLHVGSSYVGNVINVVERDAQEKGNLKGVVMTCYSIVVDEQHRGKGYGRLLLEESIQRIQASCHTYMGYFKEDISYPLAVTLGFKPKQKFDNWYDTGDSFIRCELELRSNL